MDPLEKEFIDKIDCRFPYDDELKWKGIIEEGVKLSPNAAFAVLHEICRPLRSVRTTRDQLERMLTCWLEHADHPLANVIAEAAAEMVAGQLLSVQDVIDRMRITAAYPDLYAALAVLLMSCDDTTDRLEPIYDGIVQA